MLSPGLIAVDSAGTSTFLTNSSSGLMPANYTVSSVTWINSASNDMVFDVMGNQTISDGSTASAFALRVWAGLHVSGANSTLQVGTMDPDSQAGVILNQGAQLSAASLDFGPGDGFVYSSGSDNWISSGITAGNLTLFGPGEITLTGNTSLTGTMRVHAALLILLSGACLFVGGRFKKRALRRKEWVKADRFDGGAAPKPPLLAARRSGGTLERLAFGKREEGLAQGA